MIGIPSGWEEIAAYEMQASFVIGRAEDYGQYLWTSLPNGWWILTHDWTISQEDAS